ncbi:hypothetical protein PF011_g3273 [Phytophthora fragariae]|uniref:Transmembrane protein 135 N-terminal domain-containing protein n=1 Tax=Phytophthora fragariae TaxID=53985 RepID=A0A6A3M903_9STRA|nr:hypothetical protein PF011_g3273 [Phytophthora fragariae]
MLASSQYLRALLSAPSPAPHAVRGFSVALAVSIAIANVTGNRKALLALLQRGDPSNLRIETPSRTGLALAVFIGIFRYCQRSTSVQAKSQGGDQNKAATKFPDASLPSGIVQASALAAALSTLCIAPENRPALVSLLSTNAASKLFHDFMTKNPDLAFLKPLELLVFMAAGGWIFSSGFFYPESYERSHMKTILKSVVLKQHVASELQEKYRQGLNPHPCHFRHKGLSCAQFARSDFLLRVVATSLRLYVPVHLTTWLLAQRHRHVRSKPASVQLKNFATKLMRSSAYAIGYVYLGWVLCCLLGKLGDRSQPLRKFQFFLSGAIPSLAILAESPGRRRSIGLILTSYALVSAGSVATRTFQFQRPDATYVRGLLESGCVAAAVSVVVSSTLKSSYVFRRVLLGDMEARESKSVRKKRTLSRDDESAPRT